MKKILFFLMLTLLCIPWATHAQNDQFTLFEYETGNNANWACPVWGYNLNYGDCATEFIIPTRYLDFAEGATFTKMRFYIHDFYFPEYAASVEWNVPYRVYLSETETYSFRTVSDTIGRANATLVFSGILNGDKSNRILDVVFDTPYQYHGGNLVVGFWQNGSSSVYAGQGGCAFITTSVEDTVYWVGYTDYDHYDFSVGTMIPKITFDYYGISCLKPRDLQVYYYVPGSTTAQISWVSDASDFEVEVNGVVYNFNDASPNSEHYYDINVVSGTEYTVKVKAHCNAQEESDWSLPLVFLTAPQCEVTLELTSSDYYSGWSYDAIDVWDNTNNQSLGTFRNENGGTETYTIPISEGQNISFSFQQTNPTSPSQCSWVIIAPTGDTISQGNLDNLAYGSRSDFAQYTGSCSACYITVELNNPGGTNWDGNAIGVSDNAEFLTSITPDYNEPIRVLSGHVIDFYWLDGLSGSLPTEPYSWTIRDAGGNIITQGTNDNNLQDGDWLASYTADCSSQAPVVPSQCNITFDLVDSWGDSWNGNTIEVRDASTGELIATMANENMDGTSGSGQNEHNVIPLTVDNGREIVLLWVFDEQNRCCPGECSWVITAPNGEVISEVAADSASSFETGRELATYTVNCAHAPTPTPSNYCVPAPTTVDGEGIVNVSFGTGNNIVNNSTYPTSAPYYGNYSSQIGAVAAGTTATVAITYNTCGYSSCYNYGTLIWVDWNNDGTFGDNEIVFTGQSSTSNPTGVHTLNASFAVSANQATGDYRMRIGAADSYFDGYIQSSQGNHDPCYSGENANWAVFHDYTLRVTETPSCLPPVVTVDYWTSTTANISWTDNNNGTPTYIVKMGNEVLSGSTTPAVSINGTSATLTGLTAEHNYAAGDFTVTANCNGNDFSDAANVPAFYTGYCVPAPVSVDVEGITNVSFGTGNNIVNNSTHPTSAPYYGDYTSQIGAVIVGQTATVDITFNTCGNRCFNYGTIIWVDWDNNQAFEDNEIVFTALSSQEENPAGVHTLNASFAVSPNQATGDYRMRIGAADSYFNSYITNGSGPHDPCYSGSFAVFHDYTLRVIEVPSCLPVTNLQVIGMDPDAAQITWTHGGNETLWDLYWTTSDVAPTSDTVPTVGRTPNDQPWLAPLTPNTHYYAYVRARCSDENRSQWSPAVEFTTLSPYIITFNAGNGGTATVGSLECGGYLDLSNVSATPTIYCQNDWTFIGWSETPVSETTNAPTLLGNNYYPSGNATLYAVYQQGATYNSEPVCAAPTFTITYLDDNDILDVDTFEVGATITPIADPTKEGYTFTGWTPALPATMPAQDLRVIAQWQLIPCPSPENLEVANGSITENSALITWNSNQNNSFGGVYYANGALAGTNTQLSQRWYLSELQPNTNYRVGVYAYCSLDRVSDTVWVEFTTSCEVITNFPWTENFDSYVYTKVYNELPECWNYINTSSCAVTFPAICGMQQFSHSANNHLRFDSYITSDPQDEYAILPRMQNINNLRIQLDARKHSDNIGGTVFVGVMTNPADASTFTTIGSLTPDSTIYEHYTFSFSDYTGSGEYIALLMRAANQVESSIAVCIDDIIVEEIPIEPHSITINQVTGGTIYVNVVDNHGNAYSSTTDTIAAYNAWVNLSVEPNAGYTFDDFVVTTASGIPIEIINSGFVMPAEDVIVSATFTQNTYTVSATVDPMNAGSVTGTGTYNYNTEVTLTAIPATGYSFDHWQNMNIADNVDSETANPLSFNVTEDMTYKAFFSMVNYELVYMDGEEVFENVTYNYGDTIDPMSAPEKEGYTFIGWNPAEPVTMPSHNDTLYAQWQLNPCLAPENLAVANGSLTTTSALITWSSNQNNTFGGVYYENGVLAGSNNQLYQRWYLSELQPNTNYRVGVFAYCSLDRVSDTVWVEFTTNDTCYPPVSVSISDVTAHSAKLSYAFVAQVPGDILVNLSTDPNFASCVHISTTTSYHPESLILNSYFNNAPLQPNTTYHVRMSSLCDRNADLTSVWSETLSFTTLQEYAVTIDANITNGTVTVSDTAAIEGAVVNLTATPNHGYSFGEWVVTTVNTPAPETITVTNNSFVMPEGGVNVSATFIPNRYVITYKNGNNIQYQDSVAYGTAIRPITDPTREGYTFTGWVPELPATMPAYDVTVHAQWNINKYVLTYMDGNDMLSQDSVEFGADITPVANPTKEGYTFNGWDPEVPSTMPAHDVTVTAIFTLNTYTVTATVNPANAGTVTGAGIYNYGSEVEMRAEAADGYLFSNWTNAQGAVVSTDAIFDFEITNDTAFTANFTVMGVVATPTFSPAEGTYYDAVNVELECATSGATIHYTTDGSTPTASSAIYNGPISLAATSTTTINAIAMMENMTNSAMASATYTVMPTYTVTIADNIVNGTVRANVTRAAEGVTVNLTAIADEGYHFAAWNVTTETGAVEVSANNSFAMPAGNVTISATFEANEHIITYMDGNTVLDVDTFAYGATITPIADPTKEGYSFTGWNPQLPQTMPANDVTVNALWELIPCLAAENLAVVNGSLTTTSALITWSSNQDNTFGGVYYENGVLAGSNNQLYQRWYLSELQPGTNYRVGVFAYCSLDRISDTVWVEFTTNDTCYPPVSVSISDVTAHSALLSYDFGEHVPDNFMFEISSDPDFANPVVVSTSSAYFPNSHTIGGPGFNIQSGTTYFVRMASQCTTYLTSVWSETLSFTTLQEYAVSVDADITNGTISADVTIATAGTVVNLTATPDNGYSFGEWIVTTVNTPAPEIVTVTNNSFVMPASEVNISATFTPNSYNITLNPGTGGTIVVSIDGMPGIALSTTANYNSVVDIVAVPHVGYSVGGFVVTNADGSVIPTPNDSFIMPANDVTITGTFIPNEHIITYMDDNTVLDVDTFTYGATITPIADPTKEGYTFIGWFPELPSTMPDNDVRATAQWSINRYALTYMDGNVILSQDSVDYGAPITPIADPTKEGYTFTGWNPQLPQTMPANDVTVNALWELIPCMAAENLAVVHGSLTTTAALITWNSNQDNTFGGVYYENGVLAGSSNQLYQRWYLSELQPGTNYRVGVFAYCSLDRVSDTVWVEFTTNDTCYPPVSVSISDVTAHNALLSYDFGEHVPSDFMVHISTDPDFADYDGTSTSTDYYPNSLTIGGPGINIQSGTTYYVKMASQCHPGLTSVWSETLSFTTLQEYAVSVDADITNGTISADVTIATAGTVVNLTATPDNGYSFGEWIVTTVNTPAPEIVTVTNNSFVMPEGGVNVSATFTPNSYNITVNQVTGGTITIAEAGATAGSTTNTTAKYNAWVQLNAVADNGYTFSNFVVTNADGTAIETPNNGFIMPANDVTVTAIFNITPAELSWSAESFTGYTFIDFNNWKPTLNNPNNVSVRYGCAEGNIPNQGGIEVDATTGVIGSNVAYGNMQALTGTFHIYAVHDTDPTYYYDSVVYTLNVEQGVIVALQQNIDEGGTTVFADYTDVATLTHLYTSNSTMAFVAHNDTIRVQAEPATGYHFSEWQVGDLINGYTTVSTEPLYTFMVPSTQTISIKAVFDTNTYVLNVVSANDVMGNVSGNTQAKHFLSYEISATPNAGYYFVQWNDGNTDNPRMVTLTGDATYEASFGLADYELVYMNGNEVFETVTYTYGDAINPMSAPEREGYIFIGWAPAEPTTMPAHNDTLYAQWELIPCMAAENLAVASGSLTTTSALITWSSSQDNTFGGVYYENGVLAGSNNQLYQRWSLSELQPGTDYRVGVFAYCYLDRVSDTVWVEFTTNDTCYPPVSVSISDVTAHSALLSYDFGEHVPSDFMVHISTDPDFDEYDAVSTSTAPNYFPSSMPLSSLVGLNLQSGTTYYVRMASQCSTYLISVWSETLSFTTLQEYAVTIDANIINGTVTADDTVATAGTVVNLTATPDNGYSFGEWIVTTVNTPAPEIVTVTNNSFVMPASEVNISATFTPNSYNITINQVTGGTITVTVSGATAGTTTNTTADFESWIQLSEVTEDGYTFVDFLVTDEDGEIIETPNNGFIMPASDVTVTATFSVNNYTITYLDGNSILAQDTVAYGATITPIANPTKVGYTFTGWDPALPTTMPANDLTVNAQWQINSYNITINQVTGGTITVSFAGESATSAISTTTDTSANFETWIQLSEVTLDGYTFGDFVVTTANGTPIETPNNGFIMPASDVTVTATFSVNNYTITYLDGNSILAQDTVAYGATITPIANPTKVGYTFTGWDPALPTTMPANDLTVNAQWQINSYNITINQVTGGTITVSFAGESATSVISTTTDTSANFETWIQLSEVTLDGYTFGDFVVTTANGTPIETPNNGFIMPAEDVTVTATFSVNNYTITYLDGNSILAQDTVAYGATITPIANPTKVGYTFTGWDPALPTTMPANDLTVNAQWQVNSYDITINQVTGGTITVTVTGATAGTTTNTTADFGSWVHLSVDADYAYDFGDFLVITASGDTLVTPNNSFMMPAENVTVTAIFTLHYFNVTVNVSDDTPWGTVTGGGSFVYGSTDTLTATPMDEHHIFVGWSDFNTENPRVITVTQDSTLTAYFVPEDIDIISNDTLMGDVNVNIPGGGHLTPNTPIVITATPAPHYHFVSWSDGNTDNPRTIFPMQAIGLTAIFAIDQHTITVMSNDDNMGTVDGSVTVDYGTVIQISATAYTGYEFISWNDGNTENPRYITVECDSTFIATFQLVDGIEDANLSNVNVYSYNNQVVITNAEGFSVEIFDMSGRLIVSENSISQSVCRYTISTDGIYLVKVGNNMFKKVKIAR